ncbi:MAG: sensor histidine kinase, partial [Flavobacteriaceae bacterium]
LNTLENDGEVILDKKLVKNILLNLLSNAIKYSGENQSIICNVELRPKHMVMIVEDHGIGVPEHEQDKLFQRFFRAQNAANIQGTGLGLSIIKSYVELMSGNIEYTGAENKGSTFVVTLPRNMVSTKSLGSKLV